MTPPLLNLYDMIGIGSLALIGAVFYWLLGGIGFGTVIAIGLFVAGAVWFAKRG